MIRNGGKNDGSQASRNNRRLYSRGSAGGSAAFAPAVQTSQERRAAGQGSDQVGHAIFRGPPVPVRFLRAQGPSQLHANAGGAGAISTGTEKTQNHPGFPAGSLQQALAGGSDSPDGGIPSPGCERT